MSLNVCLSVCLCLCRCFCLSFFVSSLCLLSCISLSLPFRLRFFLFLPVSLSVHLSLLFVSFSLTHLSLPLGPICRVICYTALTPMLKTYPRCRVTKEMQVSAFPVHPAHPVSAGIRGAGGTQGYQGYQAGRDHPDYLASSPSGFRALKVNTCFCFCC